MVNIHQIDNGSPSDMSSSTRRNETSDHQISELMLSPPALVRYIMIYNVYFLLYCIS